MLVAYLASFCYNDIDVSACVGDTCMQDFLRGGFNATVDLLSRGSGGATLRSFKLLGF